MTTFFDGAFGTYYVEQTGDTTPCELANIAHPDSVLAIHKAYISAGVHAIKTNTFAAMQVAGAAYEEVIKAGFTLACQAAANTGVTVYADIGALPTAFAYQYETAAATFVSLGATHFIFETLSEFAPIEPALALIKSRVANATILVSFAISQDGLLQNGVDYKEALAQAAAHPHVDIVGMNCVSGPTHLLTLTKQLLEANSAAGLPKPLAVMPNAGYAARVNGRSVFQANASYFAEKLTDLAKAGVAIVGGCCGTTPLHLSLAIQRIHAQEQQQHADVASLPRAVMSQGKKLPRKPLAVELDPPAKADFTTMIAHAAILKRLGVSCITVSDSPLAKARADSIMTAVILKTNVGIDVLPHITCRDKNYIALKGALLGAAYHGIHRLLCVTGDPVGADVLYKQAGVFNFTAARLMSYIEGLNKDVLSQHVMTLGGALNINAVQFEVELKRAAQKIESGATFLFSQPLFSQQSIENFQKARATLDCQLYAGILPVASSRNALFLNNEVTGIEIPQEVITAMEGKTTQEAYAISIAYSRRMIEAVYDSADGFYIMTPLQRIELVQMLIEEIFDA